MPVKDDLVDAIEQTLALATVSRAWALHWIAEFDAAAGWAADGAASTSDWLQMRFGIKRQTALEWVRIARALCGLPEIAKAFGKGRLTEEQVSALTGFVTAETDYEWAIDAQGMSSAELEREAQRRQRLDRETAEQDVTTRELRFHYDRAGRYTSFWGRVPFAEGTALRQRLDLEVERTRSDGSGRAEPEQPYASRMADALLRLAGRTDDPDRAEAPRPEVVVHITDSALVQPDGIGELEGGSVVASETVRRWLCHASVRLIYWDAHGNLIGVGPATRTPTPWQMRVLWERDGGCAWLGCGETRWVDAHHIIPVERKGETILENLMLCCARHHRALHELGWRVVGSPYEKLEFIRPDGTPVGERHAPPLRDDIRERLGIPRSPPLSR